MIMGAVGPLYFIVWAYLSLWGSMVLYILPPIFLIVYASQTADFVTNGTLAHLIIDITVWLYTFVIHILYFRPMVIYAGKGIIGNLWSAIFWPEIEAASECRCDPCKINKHLPKKAREIKFALCTKSCIEKCPAAVKLVK